MAKGVILTLSVGILSCTVVPPHWRPSS